MTEKNEALAPMAGVDLKPGAAFDIGNLDVNDLKKKLAAIDQFQILVRERLHSGIDYGIIPGTGDKPTLLKPGAEKIAKLLNLYDDYEIVASVEDWDKPLFRYMVRCTLIDMATGTKVSSGLGECNSYESKYRWRWVTAEQLAPQINKDLLVSKGGKRKIFEFEFALKSRETTGQYGKPESYWAAFDEAIKSGRARRIERETRTKKVFPGYEYEKDETFYRVANPDAYDQINTILKMAKKRAMIDAALSAGRLSDLYTQDLEDMIANAAGGVVEEPETKPETKPAAAPAAAAPAPQQAAKPAAPAPAAAPSNFPAENNSGYDPSGEAREEVPTQGNDVNGPATEVQLNAISKRIVELKALGKMDSDIWAQMYKDVDFRFHCTFTAISDVTYQIAEFVELRLGEWVEHIKKHRGNRNGGGK